MWTYSKEWENDICLFGISALEEVRKIYLYIIIAFQGHIGIIGPRGAVGPQGPPVSQ